MCPYAYYGTKLRNTNRRIFFNNFFLSCPFAPFCRSPYLLLTLWCCSIIFFCPSHTPYSFILAYQIYTVLRTNSYHKLSLPNLANLSAYDSILLSSAVFNAFFLTAARDSACNFFLSSSSFSFLARKCSSIAGR